MSFKNEAVGSRVARGLEKKFESKEFGGRKVTLK